MLIRRHSASYNFVGDLKTGVTFRWGIKFSDDPGFAPWPELADISISNHCTYGCPFCYRDSNDNKSFISVEDFRFILQQLQHKKWGNVFQVALGGGEPLEHPHFLKLIDTVLEFGIVANFTTNGKHVTRKLALNLKGKVGAVAVSVSNIRKMNQNAINTLITCGIRTNIHFLLYRENLSQAIDMLHGHYDENLKGINAVIFLTHKPMGRADNSDTLIWNEQLASFVKCIDTKKSSMRIGFDACFVPVLLHTTSVDSRFVDPCECGYFSIYIDEQLNVKPCSFTPNMKDYFNLRQTSFNEIWTKHLSEFRRTNKKPCKRNCTVTSSCRSGCPYFPQLNHCYSSSKKPSLL